MTVVPDESHPGGTVAILAERIIEMRNERGWRREDLAAASGLGFATIASLERGERPAHLLTIERLAVAFGCEVADLVAP
jgi:transcriptional regulator with XRE-family HTH domain